MGHANNRYGGDKLIPELAPDRQPLRAAGAVRGIHILMEE